MTQTNLAAELFAEIVKIPLIDSHSHIDPRRPTSRSLEDILGYHYYTELAHSAGMSKDLLAASCSPANAQSIMTQMARFDNTAQVGWFEIANVSFTPSAVSILRTPTCSSTTPNESWPRRAGKLRFSSDPISRRSS